MKANLFQLISRCVLVLILAGLSASQEKDKHAEAQRLNPVEYANQIGLRSEEFTSRNILVVAMVGTRSHFQFYGQITQVLADRGHNVTLISPYDPKLRSNLHHIKTDGDIDKILKNTMDLTSFLKMFSMMNTFTDFCIGMLKEPELKALDIDHFDLVVHGLGTSDCFLPLLDNSKVPMVSYVPNTITSTVHLVMGSIEFPSVTTDITSGKGGHPMSFFQRMTNIAFGYFQVWLYKYYIMSYTASKLCSEGVWCPEGASLMELSQRTSLVFINTLESMQKPPRPLPPNVVPVGGLNCRDPSPLPESLKEWADEAKEGFIYFSLGSAARISDVDPQIVSNIMETFRTLKIKVLWKSNIPAPENTPQNVRMEKWLPQQDILGHRNCLFFMSHGGLFSVTEATYHAVPLLLLPVFGDQHSNALRVVAEGWGEVLDLNTLSQANLTATVRGLISDPKYKKVVSERSALMRDQPMLAGELVVYWSEYVMRHDGAPHLRSPFYDYYWFQIYNVDIWLVICGVAMLVMAVTTMIVIWTLKKCYRYAVNKGKKKTSKARKQLKKD